MLESFTTGNFSLLSLSLCLSLETSSDLHPLLLAFRSVSSVLLCFLRAVMRGCLKLTSYSLGLMFSRQVNNILDWVVLHSSPWLSLVTNFLASSVDMWWHDTILSLSFLTCLLNSMILSGSFIWWIIFYSPFFDSFSFSFVKFLFENDRTMLLIFNSWFL